MDEPDEPLDDDPLPDPIQTTLFYEDGTEPCLEVAGGPQWTAPIPERVERHLAATFASRNPEVLSVFDVQRKLQSEEDLRTTVLPGF